MSQLKNVILDSFGLETRRGDSKVILRLSGTGDMLAVEPLKQCLKALQSEIQERQVKQLDVDIRSLYLMNSSCIKAFVGMVYALQTGGVDVAIEFIVDKNLSWQARAVGPLARMAPNLVKVSFSTKTSAEA